MPNFSTKYFFILQTGTLNRGKKKFRASTNITASLPGSNETLATLVESGGSIFVQAAITGW